MTPDPGFFQEKMLQLLQSEIEPLRNVQSSLSSQTMEYFLHSKEGSSVALSISTRSTKGLREDFLELCDMVKSKEEEKIKARKEVEKLRAELGMSTEGVVGAPKCSLLGRKLSDMAVQTKQLEHDQQQNGSNVQQDGLNSMVYSRQMGKHLHSQASMSIGETSTSAMTAMTEVPGFLSSTSLNTLNNDSKASNNPPTPPVPGLSTSPSMRLRKPKKRATDHWKTVKTNFQIKKGASAFAATSEYKIRERWAEVTGNTKAPECIDIYGVPDSPTADGVKWMIQKPAAWQSTGDTDGANSLSAAKLAAFSREQSSIGEKVSGSSSQRKHSEGKMPISDFLGSIPTFQNLDHETFLKLEHICMLQIFESDKVILREGERSQHVFVIREGNVKVLKNNEAGNRISEKVMTLTQGDYFGEGSFTHETKGSSASYISDGNVLCIAIPSDTYENIFTGESQLMGTTLAIDATNNDEVYSLTRHIDQFSELLQMVFVRTKREVVPANNENDAKDLRNNLQKVSQSSRFSKVIDRKSFFNKKQQSAVSLNGNAGEGIIIEEDEKGAINIGPPRRRTQTMSRQKRRGSMLAVLEEQDELGHDTEVSNEALQLDLLTAFTPELSLDDVMERIIKVTREVLCVQRCSVFIYDEKNNEMILRVSRDAKGIRLPVKGMSGHVCMTGELLNIPDAYDDNLFDPDMDKKSNFRTKQVLCVPIKDKIRYESHICGVMQCINTVDNEPFTSQDEDLLVMVSQQLAEVIAKQNSSTAFCDGSNFLEIKDVPTKFRLNIRAAYFNKELSTVKKEHRHITCVAQLYHGGIKLGGEMRVSAETENDSGETTRQGHSVLTAKFGKGGTWCDNSGVLVKNLPHATRIILQLYSKNGHACGWTGCNLFQFDHQMRQGNLKLRLWNGLCPTPNATALEPKTPDSESSFVDIVILSSDVDNQRPILYRPINNEEGEKFNNKDKSNNKGLDFFLSRLNENDMKKINHLIKDQDPTAIPEPEEHRLIWDLRLHLVKKPEALKTFLLCVDWMNPKQVAEVHKLLYSWETLEPMLALQILNHRFPDPRVRAYAVHCLGNMDDGELRKYLLQLTQTLKYEPFHDSALSRFLLRRALTSPTLIGHIFFWLLKAEMHEPVVRERFGVLLDLYLRNCGTHRLALGHQLLVMRRLENVANKVKAKDTKEERLAELKEQLKRCDFPVKFQLPLNPDLRVKGIVVEKCRVMESKKKPLWLVFENADEEGEEITVMFKAGDDLRQDQLTLQVLSIMDGFWKEDGLDMHMNAYKCVCTGDELGMLEVVTQSITLAGIVEKNQGKKIGKRKKLAAAIDAYTNEKLIDKWLKEECGGGEDYDIESDNNGGRVGDGEGWLYKAAQEKFLYSCAGYAVATFALGIGDRHNDNIMMKKTGELFHIDFGHFLGNFKSKYGYDREKLDGQFVLTPAMANVLGGPKSAMFKEFENLCCQCLLILRKHAGVLITLFSLMLSCGIPELQNEDDINYLKARLMVDLEEEAEVEREFKKIIKESLGNWRTRLNDGIHSYVHS